MGVGESEVIQEIANKISNILTSMTPSDNDDRLVGMNSRIEKMEAFLDLKERDDFQASCFLGNVKDKSKNPDLVVSLQKVLFKKLLYSGDDIHNVHMGINSLSRRLPSKKVLIVLDDVDHKKQIEDLVGIDWLGPGSRIIITTRNEHLLKAYGVHHIYEVEKLNDEEAFQLFCKKAFKKGHKMADDYTNLSKGVVKYANGLPLALEVLGYALCGRELGEWESEFAKLKEHPDDNIIDVLRISYDGLDETEKQIFLDIACFFKGEDHDRVFNILDACDFYPKRGIRVLEEKCLVKVIGGNRLWMHDLVQQMGWSVVLRDSLDPGERSRLWVNESVSDYKDSRSWHDLNNVLEDNLGTISVHGIFLTLPAKEELELDADPFSNMRVLKLLKICNANFSKCPEYFSRELRLLEWHEYPSESLPQGFRPSALVELKLPSSRIKQLWHERHRPLMKKLRLIDLSNCKCLTKTPDFSKVPYLMDLTLEGCEKLSELHPTIWDLQHLVSLNLKGCECLEILPHSICWKSLQTFIASGCSRLERFPEIVGNMKHLSELHLDRTGIRELPLSIERLTNLILLNLRECKNLLSLPSSICSLTSLKHVYLSGCKLIDQLPENIGKLEHLEELYACQTAIRRLPMSILLLKNLQSLCLHGCKGLKLPHSFSGLSSLISLDLSGCSLDEGAIPDDIGRSLSSLRSLGLSENNFVSIPESISRLCELKELTLFKCSNLRLLPKHLPPSLKPLVAYDCPMQTNYPETLTIWTSDKGICFLKCQESEGDEDETRHDPLPIPEEHVKQPFAKYLKDLIGPELEQGIELRVPHTAIPHWCSEYQSGTSVTIQLSDPEDSNSSWMGVALFVFFEILDQSFEMEETFCRFQASDGLFQKRSVFANFENFRVGSHGVCCYQPARNFAGHCESKPGNTSSFSLNESTQFDGQRVRDKFDLPSRCRKVCRRFK
ncbi:Disease resistance TIR-NBS-LRR class protein [Prunus dulcis]|uniref:Disease resistance TIR-NBS-LRR class protein n=1 Tax=Prunus dulcis TaxID=3755 RepID=A0A4Y1RE40_PRUDU|nr:Disease resistance TIR-NBS-LRR class protein [Prunus dulcis]